MTLEEFFLQNLTYILPLIAAVLAFAIGRLLKLTVSSSQILSILSAIVKAIWHVEVMSNEAEEKIPGKQKLELAKNVTISNLSAKNIGKAVSLFGSITGAVQAVFNVIKPIMDAKKR